MNSDGWLDGVFRMPTSNYKDPFESVKLVLTQLKTYLAQENPRKLSEADTKANFIEPIVDALGWSGIGTVTREYYVRNSQEFIDYVMFARQPQSDRLIPILAIEAKALFNELTEKHAAQLVQYCAVEGIEWAALTNGRELQFFNTFLKPDLEAKRVIKLDLLAFNTDAEFEALFDQLWRLSRESLMEPTGVRTWLNQLRLDTELRRVLLDPSSSVVRQLGDHMQLVDIDASPNDLAIWFRKHLAPTILDILPSPISPESDSGAKSIETAGKPASVPGWLDVYGMERWPETRELLEVFRESITARWSDIEWRATKYYVAASISGETIIGVKLRSSHLIVGLTLPKSVRHPRLQPVGSAFNWRRMSYVVEIHNSSQIDDDLLELISKSFHSSKSSSKHYGVSLRDLVDANVIAPGTKLVLKSGSREITEATLTSKGQIEWRGSEYSVPSAKAFARLLGPSRISINGWTHWHAKLPSGDVQLSELRQRLTRTRDTGS